MDAEEYRLVEEKIRGYEQRVRRWHNVCGILFLAFWLVMAFYLGEKKSHENCREYVAMMYEEMTPEQKQRVEDWVNDKNYDVYLQRSMDRRDSSDRY